MVLYMQGEMPEPISRPINYWGSPYRYWSRTDQRVVPLVFTRIIEGDCMIDGELIARTETQVVQTMGYNFLHHEIIEVWHVDNPHETLLFKNGTELNGDDRALRMSANGSLLMLGNSKDVTKNDEVYYGG